ncbi:MAG: 50S ribosomal protein L32 [Armatimonadetes bacterium]|nr:MAG: 50S ribosomal protein L32 [Armatimonadota bacterium]
MPAEPKRKHSKARKRTRRASIKMQALGLIKCANCQQPTISHRVCKSCGYYSGKQVEEKTAVKVTKV